MSNQEKQKAPTDDIHPSPDKLHFSGNCRYYLGHWQASVHTKIN